MALLLSAESALPWPGLPETERRVFRELLLHGAQPRVRIAEKLGLSRTSLTRIARGLLDAGYVVEGESLSLGGRGRPGEALEARRDAARFAGVKLTGDRMYLVIADLGGCILVESSAALPSREVDDVVMLLARELRELVGAGDVVTGVGVALAGDVTTTPAGPVLRRSNFLGWDDVPLAALVADATGLPVSIVNDVHALAGAQHWFGGDPQDRSVAVFGLGAGIGCGIVLDGELHSGVHGRAGRVGHSRIGGRGARCENGHRDCVHSFVTMPAIERNAGLPPGEYPLALERARAHDPAAMGAFAAAARALGAAVAETVNAFDPEAVAIMGEGVDMLDLSPDEFRRALAEFLEQGAPDDVRIERPPFHFGLYARGAAVAVMRELLA
jgi:predicted NBD/HSP70 family sugar kinase